MQTLNNSILTTPRLLDTTLCPFSATKKSIAYTYNNQSLYIPSLSKDYYDDSSIIHQSRSKLKIRKLILESVPESIQECTRKLLSRVGENDSVLNALLKFFKVMVSVVNRMENQMERLVEENIGLKGMVECWKRGGGNGRGGKEKQNLFGVEQASINKQNELKLKIRKLEGAITQLAKDEIDPPENSPSKNGRSSLTKDMKLSLEQQNKALMLAYQEITKVREQKDNYFYMMNNFKLQISRLKQQYSTQQPTTPALSKQNEDIEFMKQQIESLTRQEKDHIKNCQSLDTTRAKQYERQIRKLKQKLLNLSSLIGRGDFQLLENQEKDAIQKIKKEISDNVGFKKCTQQQFKMIDKYDNGDDERQKESDSKYHQQLKIYYPTFFNLLTQQIKQFEVELKLSYNKAVTPDLFLRIRAILDSKYNELVIAENDLNTTRFTDFVFGWFQRFDISTETKRIVQHNKPGVESQYSKKQFLISLFNPKIQKLNQILTFRQFLLHQSPQDQIYYYLHCRAMFFKGGQLDHFVSTSDTLVFLPHQHILKQVGMLIGKYPKQVQNIIIYNINLRRKKKINNQYFIDVSFVLRTLLEVYRAHKRQKYEKMKLVMMKLQNTLGNKEIKFIYFRELIELNFPKITVSALSYMYRQTINIYKNNKIDFFGAFYAASHEKLFIYSIKQDLANNVQSVTQSKTIMNISAILPPTLGIQSLNEELKYYFTTSLPDLYTQNNLLLKAIRLLSLKDQNKQYVKMVREKFKLSFESNMIDVKTMTDNMIKKDQIIKNAAVKLTRAFRYRIKLYYDKFLEKINSKIQQINKAALVNK